MEYLFAQFLVLKGGGKGARLQNFYVQNILEPLLTPTSTKKIIEEKKENAHVAKMDAVVGRETGLCFFFAFFVFGDVMLRSRCCSAGPWLLHHASPCV